MAVAPFRQIDVFVGEGARGNPAGVALLDAPLDDAGMQARARAIGLPATAFVARAPVAGAHAVRWFAPEREIALCGHGALAAGHVLLSQSSTETVRLIAAGGRELEVRRLEGDSRYELGLPAIPTEPRAMPELLEMLGAMPGEARWNADGYALAVFPDAETVRALSPDFDKARALDGAQIIATAPSGREIEDIVSRVFSGGVEDAATGSAHAVLTPYWCDRLGREQFTAFQASTRGGRFACRLEGDLVWLGGEVREGAR